MIGRIASAVMPESEMIALDLTCAECGRSPGAGETWRILFADKHAGRGRGGYVARLGRDVDQEPPRTQPLSQASGRRSLVQRVKEMRSRWRLRAAQEVLAREAHSRAWERQKGDLSKTNRKFTGPHPPPG